jgi:urease accessory protein UreE
MTDVLQAAGELHRALQPLEDRARTLAAEVPAGDPDHDAVQKLLAAVAGATEAAFALGNRHDPTG